MTHNPSSNFVCMEYSQMQTFQQLQKKAPLNMAITWPLMFCTATFSVHGILIILHCQSIKISEQPWKADVKQKHNSSLRREILLYRNFRQIERNGICSLLRVKSVFCLLHKHPGWERWGLIFMQPVSLWAELFALGLVCVSEAFNQFNW